MNIGSSWRRCARALLPASLLLTCAMQVHAIDLYSNGLLVMPTLMVGSATLSNVSVTVKSIVTLPSGTAPRGSVDTYDPASGLLTVQSVSFSGHTFYNVVVEVGSLVAVGSASGADAFTPTGPSGGNLTLSHVMVGGTVFDNVVLAISLSNVTGLLGGMPAANTDSYNGKLTAPIISALGHVYTNVTLSVGPANITHVGGTHTGVLSTGFYSTTATATAGSAMGTWGYYGHAQNPTLYSSSGAYILENGSSASNSFDGVQIDATLATIGNTEQVGIYLQPAAGQTVNAGGFGKLSFNVGTNPQWYADVTLPNFVVLLTANVPGVSTTAPPCNPQVAAVVTATGFLISPYTLPLSAFTTVVQNCGTAALTPAQVIDANVVQIDFQGDGGNAAITASGLTSNANFTVPDSNTSSNYMTTIKVQGGVNFSP